MHPHFWPEIPKPNFQNGEMNVSYFLTMNYEQETMNYANKNEPKTNPNEPNFLVSLSSNLEIELRRRIAKMRQ